MSNYVAAHPSATTLVVLERALAARGWAARVPSVPAAATLTVDGVARQVRLEAGQGTEIALTPAQAASATIESVSGSVLAVQTWDAALAADALSAPAGVTLTRVSSPSGTFPVTAAVVVTLSVTVPSTDGGTCWRVVDTVPSGLAPIPWFGTYPGQDENGNLLTPDVSPPTFIDGQRVEFCAGGDPKRTAYTLRYVARVVTPGTYTWEPAVLQSTAAPAEGVAVAPTTITIETPGG
jgi:uncharacterized protein YfaS (alpha-2-macroglobulin family)